MQDISLLPPADHYQYFSHLFHAEKFIPFDEYIPQLNWDYPEFDLQRFKNLFLQDLSYVKDCRILDIGCHTGYFSYIAKYLGAQSIHGINARMHPLKVAEYAYSQLNITNFKFDQHNIEDLNFLKLVCQDKDTLILTLTLEHLRNPYAILEIISKSDIKNLIFESSIIDDDLDPTLKYYVQSTESAFTVYDDDLSKKVAFGCCPNLAWIEQMLYWFGWRIESRILEHKFNKNHFSTPGLEKFPPRTQKTVTIHCKKFDGLIDKNNYEK
jgi:SAM-dependent methyltransferase